MALFFRPSLVPPPWLRRGRGWFGWRPRLVTQWLWTDYSGIYWSKFCPMGGGQWDYKRRQSTGYKLQSVEKGRGRQQISINRFSAAGKSKKTTAEMPKNCLPFPTTITCNYGQGAADSQFEVDMLIVCESLSNSDCRDVCRGIIVDPENWTAIRPSWQWHLNYRFGYFTEMIFFGKKHSIVILLISGIPVLFLLLIFVSITYGTVNLLILITSAWLLLLITIGYRLYKIWKIRR